MRFLLIIFVFLFINVINADQARFRITGNETIYDSKNGLIWQQSPLNKQISWKDALNYAKNLRLSNLSRWRLPTVDEFKKLIEGHLYQNVRRGAEEPWKWLNTFGFKKIRPGCYWTSNEDGTYRAWSMCMGEGQVATMDKKGNFNSFVICVHIAEM